MKKATRYALPALAAVGVCGLLLAGPADRPHGIPQRIAWTTSRLTGSPEPPPPYRVERIFAKLTFKNPLLLTRMPGSDRLYIGEQAGKLFSFPNNPAVEKADLFFDLTKELHSWDPNKAKGVGALYGLAFHPQFTRNRYCYVCYVLDSKDGQPPLPDGTRVSRFRVTDADPPRIDPASEQVVITWLAGGHNGGDLHFGPDGRLYISTGDATDPSPPDRLDTGQDLGDLLSSVLRIDVDHTDPGKNYAVPPDNPFVKLAGARPEVWAYGFRNPWRMSFDRATGDLWVGDVGWELWEMVYRVRKGGNYGWSVMEGRQQVRPEAKRGPTPILPPALDFPHTEAASITGGYVYRGKRLPELAGAYLCGDWMTRKVWATRFDAEDHILSHKEIALSPGRVVAFGEDAAGELYLVHHDEAGWVGRLVPNPAAANNPATFPTKLSETGLFASVREHTPAPGVVPYSINAEQWLDGATAERLLAVPGTGTVRVYDEPMPVPGTAWFTSRVFFPKDGVLARTLSLELERGNPQTRRRVETQVLHFDGEDWRGYSYQWNDDQTDAGLVPAAGADREFAVRDPEAPGGKRKQTWHFPARGECLQCHNPWAGPLLAFNLPQLDKPHPYGPTVDDQVRALRHAGLIELLRKEKKNGDDAFKMPPALVNPYDPAADLTRRARSYLHANCSHCHRFGAGGTAQIDLNIETPLEKSQTLDARPVQGTFEIPDARIIVPGNPYHSVLFYRMAKLGRGRMPHLGSEVIDERGLRLMHDWIRQLGPSKEDHALAEQLRSAGKPEVLNRLLGTTSGALALAYEVGEKQLPEPVRAQAVAAATARPEPTVRDLFERFLPDEQRVKRLGNSIKPEQLLALKGDAARGKELFFKSAGLQCVNCHRVHGTGSTLGPDLSQVGKQYTRAQILESLLEPSKKVDPKYVTYLLETTDGQVHTGLLGEKTESEVVLRLVGDKEVRVPAGKVQTLATQKNSIMPEQLLRDLTAEQAADLLEFLASLK
jgi:putative heme-binding domain-containing protein